MSPIPMSMPIPLTTAVEAGHEAIAATMTRLAEDLAEDVDPSGFAGWKLSFLWRLRDLQNLLLKHFDLEEEGGFTADMLRLAPQRALRIRQLESEHRVITALVSQLTTMLKRMDRLTDVRLARLRDQMQDLVQVVRTHDAAECPLIQAVYYDDFGAGG